MAILIGPLDIVRHLSNNLTFLLQERMLARQRRPILCYGLGKPSVIAQLAFRPAASGGALPRASRADILRVASATFSSIRFTN